MTFTLDLYAQFCPILANKKYKTIRKITEFAIDLKTTFKHI